MIRNPLDDLPAPLKRSLPDLMKRAINSAKRTDAPFGCSLADYASGRHLFDAPNSTDSDPTGHAEMNGLRLLASKRVKAENVVLISTAEPCPMCAAACYWAGIRAVVFGTSIQSLIRMGWRQIDLEATKLIALARPASSLVIIGDYMSKETDPLYLKRR